MIHPAPLTETDRVLLERVYQLALEAEAGGNLPIAALLAHGSTTLAEAVNGSLVPAPHPGRHAEVEVLRLAPGEVWRAPRELALYTSLEPCLMCFGAIVLHRVGRVVFGALDPVGGVLSVIPALPSYVRSKAEAVEWVGPADPERFDVLARRALELGSRYREAAR